MRLEEILIVTLTCLSGFVLYLFIGSLFHGWLTRRRIRKDLKERLRLTVNDVEVRYWETWRRRKLRQAVEDIEYEHTVAGRHQKL